MTEKDDARAVAEGYHALGHNVVPFCFIKEGEKEAKKPLVQWKEWISRPQTKEEFDSLPWDRAQGFGLVCGTKNDQGYYLGVVDYDTKDPKITEEVKKHGRKVLTNLPITQMEKTRNNGFHYIYLSKQPVPTVKHYRETATLELQGEGSLIIMAPSEGYKRMNDNTPTIVNDLKETFLEAVAKTGIPVQREKDDADVENQFDNYSFQIERIIDISKLTKVGPDEYQGKHPDHDSTTGKNFTVNTRTNSWHCFRHNSGGGALQYLAVKEGIIKCEQAKKGALRGKKFKQVLQIAAAEGLVDQKVLEQAEINPVILAKDLMDDYVFVTDQNTNTLYYYEEEEEKIYSDKTEQLIKREIAKRLDENFKTRYYNEINEFITATAPLVRMNALKPEILAVKNGLLNVLTRDLKDFSSDVYLTSKLDVEYKPEIKYSESYNARFLKEVAANETQRRQIQELIGHCIIRKIMTETSLVCLGKGGNGKSIFLTIIKMLLGDKNVSSKTIQQLCYDKFSLIEIRSKLANICADLPHREILNTGVFKALVSGDSVDINIKHVQGKGETIDPYTKYLYSANHLPPIQSEEDCYAWYRRFIFADFKRTFTPRNSIPRQELLSKLSAPDELSALLNWALEGLERLSKNGDVSDKPSVEAIRKEYRKRSSTTLAYFDDQVTVTDSYDDWVLTDDWFRDYVTYCHNNDLKPKSKGEFLKEVEQDLPGVKKTKIRPAPKTSPLSAWRYIKFVPCVPRVPTSGSLSSKNEKNHQQQKLSISGEKADKRGTDRTDGTANEKGVLSASGKPVLNVNQLNDGDQPYFNQCYFCGQPIIEPNAVTNGFTENRPAHKSCYDKKFGELKSHSREEGA